MLTRTSPFAASMTIHVTVAILLFTMISIPVSQTPVRSRGPIIIDIGAYHRALKLPGGGGGGVRSLLAVNQGSLPKQAPHPFTPPMVPVSAKEPVLLMAPALIVSPNLPEVNLPQWGDPLAGSHVVSSGSGSGGGIGQGQGGSFGPGKGPGIGPGPGGLGEGARYGGSHTGVVAPKVLYQVDPEFSEEARRAKHYGTVILVVDVDTSGRAVNFRIAKSLGLGLDEKAVEAVSRWRFRPAQKDGKPVVVPATIEVNFHLL